MLGLFFNTVSCKHCVESWCIDKSHTFLDRPWSPVVSIFLQRKYNVCYVLSVCHAHLPTVYNGTKYM